jgi:pentatricopeptide repeat protein
VSVGFEFVDVIESGDIRPYNMLVHACATAGDLQAATLAINKMKRAGFEPDLQAYTTLLGACSKCGDVERAFEVYAELKRAGFEPNEKTYGSMIDAISRDLAKSLAGSRKRRVDSEHVRSTLQSCFMIFEEIKSTNMKLDKIVMNSLLTACARAAVVPSVRREACEKLATVHAEMLERGFELDSYAYQALICCALAEKNYTKAFEYFDEMHDAGINGTTEVYTVMIRAYGKLGKSDKARLIWFAMLEDGITPDQMSYATMMRLALLDEDDDFCDELMTSMRRNRVRPGPELYSTLTGVAARHGDAPQVEEIMQNAKKRGVIAPIECYNSLIAAHARADRPDLAIEAANKLEEAGYELDAISYEGLIFAYAFARDVEEASNMFERLLESGIRPTFPTFNCLVAARARSGNMDEARRLVSVMKQHG